MQGLSTVTWRPSKLCGWVEAGSLSQNGPLFLMESKSKRWCWLLTSAKKKKKKQTRVKEWIFMIEQLLPFIYCNPLRLWACREFWESLYAVREWVRMGCSLSLLLLVVCLACCDSPWGVPLLVWSENLYQPRIAGHDDLCPFPMYRRCLSTVLIVTASSSLAILVSPAHLVEEEKEA